jgi:hypothetical protein
VQGGLLLDVVVRERAAILELLSSEDQTLLIRGDTYNARSDVVRKEKGEEEEEKIDLTWMTNTLNSTLHALQAPRSTQFPLVTIV